jgi:OOP family OmpA-OmpF porin
MLGFMALAAMSSPLTQAEDSGWYDSGWYMGGNIGQSKADLDDERIAQNLLEGGFATTVFDENDSDTGYKLFGGYQFNRYFALEGGYFDLGEFDFTATTIPVGTLSGNLKLKGVNVDLVGFLPFTEKFSAFGRAGVNYAETKDSFSGTGAVNVVNPNASEREANLKLGVGLQYDFNDAWAMRLETERYRINDAVGNKGDVDLVSLGVIYRFGAAPEPVAPVVIKPVAIVRPPVVVVAPPPPAPRFVKYTLSANELFAFDSSEVRLPQPQLDEIAKALKGEGSPEQIVITGYTDNLGSDSYNQKLSERRSLGVKNYMVSKGVAPDRLIAVGRGEVDPVAVCNDTNKPALIKCLAPNRRIEIDEMTIVKEVKK